MSVGEERGEDSVSGDGGRELTGQTAREESVAGLVLPLLTPSVPHSLQIVGEVLKQLTEEKCKFICSYFTFASVSG